MEWKLWKTASPWIYFHPCAKIGFAATTHTCESRLAIIGSDATCTTALRAADRFRHRAIGKAAVQREEYGWLEIRLEDRDRDRFQRNGWDDPNRRSKRHAALRRPEDW